MKVELGALEKNQTCELTSLPIGHKAISSKWVYNIKYKASGKVNRYKARLVIRGFDQKEGTDYKHTFSPMAKLATVRVLIDLATAKGWPLHQLDINNAFLDGFFEEDIYMKPSAGYTTASPGQVYKLKKSLYGLKQASRDFIYKTGFGSKIYHKGFGIGLVFLGNRYLQNTSSSASQPICLCSTDLHMQAGLYLLKYLKRTVSKGLFYPVQPHLQITGFLDADWAACLMTRRPLTG
nr:retrovirus-related Pol polyprotein from transposon TNT 1-94 [Tanacetum cinerariifolium]